MHDSGLQRRLGLGDAVVIGLGAMLGAGVFSAFAPAAGAAGTGILLALGLAAVVAYCNAMSSARLAAVHPQAGGTYVYGRRQLGPLWGFLAGWSFVVGKIASGAAMALTAGAYAWPAHPRPVALLVTVLLTAVNYCGITRTAALTRALVTATLVVLAIVVLAGSRGGAFDAQRLTPVTGTGAHGVLQAAGLLFFAFAGYARIATLGEEVRDPARTIVRAIPIALGIVVAVYAAVAVTALGVLGADALAASAAPLRDVVAAGSWHALAPVVRLGALAASLGVLLSLLAGVGRTTLAMARDGELPRAGRGASAIRRTAPRRARRRRRRLRARRPHRRPRGDRLLELWRPPLLRRRQRQCVDLAGASTGCDRALAALGLLGCLALAFALPLSSVIGGLIVVAAGLAGRSLVSARR